MTQICGCSVPRRLVRRARLACSGALMLTLSGAHAWGLSAPPPALKPLIAVLEADRPQAPVTLVQATGEAATFKASNASGPAGQPIPLKVDPLGTDNEEDGQLFVFTGLPAGVTLHPGGNFGDFWAVNASVISDLTLITPSDFSGTFTVWITRSRKETNSAKSASITVTIGQPATTPTAATAEPARRETAAPATRETTAPASRDTGSTGKPRSSGAPNEAMLMARANENFAKGDVAGARVIYEYLAMQGSSMAAMAMGETYDPLVLAKLVVKGLEADPQRAQEWYEKAEALGSQEARSRLNALAAR